MNAPLDEVDLNKLEEENARAEREFEQATAPPPPARTVSPRARADAATKLDALLTKAQRYTAFLEQQMLKDVTTEASSSSLGTADENADKRARVEGTIAPLPKSSPAKPQAQPPSLTGGTLKEYQLRGLTWLVGLWENGLNGILADDMGLGKTVQVIAYFCHLRELGVRGTSLVVAPLSTLANWIAEFERFAPGMPTMMYHGDPECRADLRRSLATRHDAPVVVTTYEIVVRDRAALGAAVASSPSPSWCTLVVDEGHRLKNHECRLARELHELVGTAEATSGGCTKILLTGTPLQNNLTELWALLHFLLPSVFNDARLFVEAFEIDPGAPTSSSVTSSSTSGEPRMSALEAQVVAKLHRILRPFVLRRLKSEVERMLPPKVEAVLYCPMVPSQRDMYDSVRRGELGALLREASGGEDRRSFLNTLMQLRKAAIHPWLHVDPTADPTGGFGSVGGVTDESIVTSSGKMIVLDRLLTSLAASRRSSGHKVLIFSQFTTALDLVDDYLRFVKPQWAYTRLDGGTPREERHGRVQSFNLGAPEDAFVFLLSTRAGGVGVNLVGADTVIILDSDWNPHQDSQAIDRAHRIGQTKPVVVYRLVTHRSVEVKMLAAANSKRKLERVVCSQRALATHVDLGPEELRALLSDDYALADDVLPIDPVALARPGALLLDRVAIFDPAKLPRRGPGYEIVEHKASAVVGEIVAGGGVAEDRSSSTSPQPVV